MIGAILFPFLVQQQFGIYEGIGTKAVSTHHRQTKNKQKNRNNVIHHCELCSK